MESIITILLGITGLIFSMTSMLTREKNVLIIQQFLANISFAGHFYLLGADAGFLSCLSVGFQSLIIYSYNRYYGMEKEVPDAVLIIFLFTTLLIDPNHGWGRILPNIATVFTVYALKHKNIRISKIYYLIVGLLWVAYDLQINETINLITQILFIASIVGSYLFFVVFKKDNMSDYILNIFKREK
jgi:hypothetical protein